jgi:hypothetical protein
MTGTPGIYGGHPGVYGPATPGGYTSGGPPGTPHTPGSHWAAPRRLVGADPSTGKKGELWGLKAGEDLSMLQAWSPPGIASRMSAQAGAPVPGSSLPVKGD